MQDVETLEQWRVPFALGFAWEACVAHTYFDTFAAPGFDNVQFAHFCGYANDEPVATSTVFFSAGVAGLYNVARVPEHRGKGHGTALTLAALREARERDYATAVLHATEAGAGLYRRIGFREYCRLEVYVTEGQCPHKRFLSTATNASRDQTC